MTRGDIHKEAIEAWLNSDRKNTLLLGTGIGKSKVAIDILKSLKKDRKLNKHSKILLLVDSTLLRDSNWREEFIKWKATSLWDQVVAQCYQTVYKWKGSKWDLVIADEIDFALSPKLSRFFINNTCKSILGLTGTITEDKETKYLNEIAPVCYTFSTHEAQSSGILNKTRVIFVEYELSTVPSIMDRGRYKSENAIYIDREEYVNSCLMNKQLAEMNCDRERINKWTNMWKYAARKRKEFLHSLPSSIEAATKLKNLILDKNPDNKVIVFSVLTKQVHQICDNLYTGTKKTSEALTKFNKGIVRELGICKAIDRGANLKGANNCIMETFVGSSTAFRQRNGRGCRLNSDDIFSLYILVPTYEKYNRDGLKETAYTQTNVWATKMLADFKCAEVLRIKL